MSGTAAPAAGRLELEPIVRAPLVVGAAPGVVAAWGPDADEADGLDGAGPDASGPASASA